MLRAHNIWQAVCGLQATATKGAYQAAQLCNAMMMMFRSAESTQSCCGMAHMNAAQEKADSSLKREAQHDILVRYTIQLHYTILDRETR